jgi:hypothetical protein
MYWSPRMSDEQIRNQQKNNGENDPGAYEHEDLSPRGVIYFMVGLAVLVVILYLIVFGMYRFLDSYEQAHQPAMSPMVAPQADTRSMTSENTQTFPEPRLEENERTQLRQIVEDQDARLATYNWVDKDKGVVQIPIDRAMDLLVERGLPVRSENARAENGRQQGEGSTPAQTSAPAGTKQQPPKAKAHKASASGN